MTHMSFPRRRASRNPIKAALDAREDDNTVLIARTDALGVNGFEDAIERAERYLEAGADVLFIEAPKSVAQMQHISQQFSDRIPLVHNLVEGGSSPVADSAALQQLNYKIALYPAALLHQFVPNAQQLLQHILQQGSTDAVRDKIYNLSDMNKLLGADELLASGKRYGQND